MRVLNKISEADFELEFLRSEWYKPFYEQCREQYKDLISNPDTLDLQQNYLRKKLLWQSRGPLLQQLPLSVDWYLIELNIEEFESLRVIKEFGWNKTFGEKVSLKQAALAVQDDVPDEHNVDFPKIRNIKAKIGHHEFKEKIILISSGLTEPYTVLEGNHRAVAFALKRIESGEINHIPQQYILGISPVMSKAYWLNV